MICIKTKIKGKCFCFSKVDYGYLDATDHYRQYVWKVWYLFFIPIWFKTLMKEDVPSFAIFQMHLFGSTDWKSSRPDLIDSISKK